MVTARSRAGRSATSRGVRDQLLAAYATDRGYHDTRHLAEVLDRIDELARRASPSTTKR